MTSSAASAPRVWVVIPARDEAAALPAVLEELATLPAARPIVVDNGSRDDTARVARSAGAIVLHEPRAGYGNACRAALAYLAGRGDDGDVVVFLDADGSDDPRLIPTMAEPLARDEADFVLASRALGRAEPGSLTRAQRLGNHLVCRLMRNLWHVAYSDLAPCRGARLATLRALALDDTGFGWNVQMQIRAARHGLRVREVASHYRRRRHGRSKISGSLSGSVRAGAGILRALLREWARGYATHGRNSPSRVAVSRN